LFINKRRGVMNNWLRALSIAKILMEEEGYHTLYLEELETYIKEKQNEENRKSLGKRERRQKVYDRSPRSGGAR